MSEDLVKDVKNGSGSPKINEPSENEPCIEDKNRSRRFLNDAERRLRQHSGLSRVGLYVAGAVLLVLIILFITVVCLAATWPRQLHYLQFPICKDAPCLRAAAKIQSSLNRLVSPCDNIWEFACGGWLKNNQLPSDKSSWSFSRQLAKQQLERIRNLVTTFPLPLRTATVPKKIKNLYDSCMDVDNINNDDERPLKTIISELGGWNILRNWNSDDFEYSRLLKNLHLRYGVSPYFTISVKPNPRNPGSNSIVISPSGLGLPDRSYYYNNVPNIHEAYKQFIQDVIIYLSVTKNDAKKFGEDMFNYEKRIAEITPDSSELLNPIKTYNPIKLSELKLTAASLPLENILTDMFSDSNINEETEVIVTSVDYLTKVSQIVSSTDRATINNYAMWTLTREYLPYLSLKFTKTLHLFNAELLGIKNQMERWEQCTELLQKFMSLGVESSLELKDPIDNKTKNVITQLFRQITTILREKIKTYEISTELRKYLDNKLKNLKLQIGLPYSEHNVTFVKDFYSVFSVIKDNFFSNAKTGLTFKQKVFKRYLLSDDFNDQITSHLLEHPSEITYFPPLNIIIVPRSFLTEDVFEIDYPSSIIYGKIGIPLAYSIISSILPHNSAWNSDLKILSPFHFTVNESIVSIDNLKSCLNNILLKNNLATEENVQLISLSTIKHLLSVYIAHEALLNRLIEQPHVHISSLENFEDSALFFITYAQDQCYISTDNQELYNNYVKHKLSKRSLLQTAWLQLDDFSTSLNCIISKNQQCNAIF